MNKITIIRRTTGSRYMCVEINLEVDHLDHAIDHYRFNYLQDEVPGVEILFIVNGQLVDTYRVVRQQNQLEPIPGA